MKKLLLAAAIATISSGALAAENNGYYLGAEAGIQELIILLSKMRIHW